MAQYYTEFELWIDWGNASDAEIINGLSETEATNINTAIKNAGHAMVKQANTMVNDAITDITLHLSSDKSTIQMLIDTKTELSEDEYDDLMGVFVRCIGFDYYDDYNNIITLKAIRDVYTKHDFSIQWDDGIYVVDPTNPEELKDDFSDTNYDWLVQHVQNARNA